MMQLGNRLVFKYGEDTKVYLAKRFTTDKKKVNLGNAVRGKLWIECKLLRIATEEECIARRRIDKTLVNFHEAT